MTEVSVSVIITKVTWCKCAQMNFVKIQIFKKKLLSTYTNILYTNK